MRSTAPGIVPAIAVDRSAVKPLYQQICDGFRDAIVERRLIAGQRLPSTRALARDLRISRIPVLQAFDQLLSEGYFESRTGSGTFVSNTLPEPVRVPKRPAASTHPARRALRAVGRCPDLLLRSTPEPWIKGFGAFRVSEPALDHFPFKIWSRLVAPPRPIPAHYFPQSPCPSSRALRSMRLNSRILLNGYFVYAKPYPWAMISAFSSVPSSR